MDPETQLKPQVYLDPRPAADFQDLHRWARAHEPDWVYRSVKALSRPYVRLAFRLRATGLEHLPPHGPIILAPNHFSALDHWFVGMMLGRRVRFMAKSQLFRGRALRYILSHGGAFPVRRGYGDAEAIETAVTILRGGGCLVIYPEGGRSRSGRIGDRARPGVGRLALLTGAPVVPVAVHGSEHARNWRRLRFPRVRVAYGPPLYFDPEDDPSRERQQEVADAVLKAVRRLHADAG